MMGFHPIPQQQVGLKCQLSAQCPNLVNHRALYYIGFRIRQDVYVPGSFLFLFSKLPKLHY